MLTRVARETMLSPVIVTCYDMSLMLVCTWCTDEQFKSRDTEDNQSFCHNTCLLSSLSGLVINIINLRQCLFHNR